MNKKELCHALEDLKAELAGCEVHIEEIEAQNVALTNELAEAVRAAENSISLADHRRALEEKDRAIQQLRDKLTPWDEEWVSISKKEHDRLRAAAEDLKVERDYYRSRHIHAKARADRLARELIALESRGIRQTAHRLAHRAMGVVR